MAETFVKLLDDVIIPSNAPTPTPCTSLLTSKGQANKDKMELRRPEKPHARRLHTTQLGCTHRPSESKFLVKVAGAKHGKWKCGVKSRKPEIKGGTFVFISKVCSVTHPDFWHACNITEVCQFKYKRLEESYSMELQAKLPRNKLVFVSQK